LPVGLVRRVSRSIARRYAEHCATLAYDDLPPDVREYLKKLVADTVGTAVGGYRWTESGETMVGAALDLGGGGGDGTATVLATGESPSPADAALANGALSHSLDYDNRHSAGSLHVGSSVTTAALAAAERTGASGRRFLAGVAAGYDVAARLGRACNPRSSHERGFHPTGACGTFGATAAVGVVEGFDEAAFHTAFGVNGSQASGSYQCSLTGGWNKRIHPGLAARDAFSAAAYATNGFRSPTRPIEGDLGFLQAYADRPRPDRATADLGEVYEAARTKIKPYPLGTFAHVPVSLLCDIREAAGLDPEAVESVRVEIPRSGAAMFGRGDGDGHPTESAEAQFDVPFAAALALVHGEAGLRAFDDALSGPYTDAFRRVMDRTTTVGSDDLEASLPEFYPARVRVETADDAFERSREWVEGEPEHPLSWDALERKLDELLEGVDADAGSVVGTVRSLESGAATDLVEPFGRG